MDPRKRPPISGNVDDARLLPHLRERARLERTQAKVLRGEYERATETGRDVTLPTRRATATAEPGDLRGIPVLAKGVGGTSPGTNPLTETERRLDRGKRAA